MKTGRIFKTMLLITAMLMTIMCCCSCGSGCEDCDCPCCSGSDSDNKLGLGLNVNVGSNASIKSDEKKLVGTWKRTTSSYSDYQFKILTAC